jgi:ATP-dependent Clp protease ATP-binding subunit ClpC
LRRARVGFEKGNRPVAAFLFYGPTGVGKTELSKTIARVYFGDQKLMLRLDMSEFQKPSDIDKLIGYSEGNEYRDGQLTQYVLQHPFSLILLDELEKAHPKVLDIFLQILDNGVITDGIGRDVSFKNTIIVATSNAGSNLIASEVAKNKTYKQIRPLAAERLKSYFRIEFLNRFDAVVMFHPLSISDAHQIAEMLLFREKDLLKQKGIEFVFSKQLVDRLVNKGFNQQYGARSLKRQITSKVRDKVAEAVIAGHLQPGDVFSLE